MEMAMFSSSASRFILAAFLAASLAALFVYLTDGGESKQASSSDSFAQKLVVHSAPRNLPDFTLDLPEGAKPISAFQGQFLIINFWATWCAPCRREMPQFEHLQALLAAYPVQITTISLDRGQRDKPDAFLDELGIVALLRGHDGQQALARQIGLFGVPTTILVDQEGRELARLQGEVEWDSEEAVAAITAVIEASMVP
jgi:thiol-disulfide isomerase/thioredoxin